MFYSEDALHVAQPRVSVSCYFSASIVHPAEK